MAIARIDNYLAKENRTFEEGRMLYEQYGTNIFILALIRSGTGAYQFKRLIEALTELSTKGLTDSPAKPVSRNIPIQPKKKEIPALETFHTEVIRGVIQHVPI
ncbi:MULTISPECIES: hypothetical protein [Olivibacter]|uniref:Uncharacterized protein n=1 Tax=Olivibacter jilunii TaxID=985016 RepID=A0ABW6AZ79_9SPHI